MTEDEKLLGELCDPKRLDRIAPDARRRLWRALMESLTPQDDSSSIDEVMEDFVSLDHSLECEKNEKTGVLNILTVTPLAGRSDRPTRTRRRVIEVKPDAQRFLRDVLAESIAADEAAGRTPPKPSTLQ